mmetsp:Transcript_80996/g.173154  ORF Transcript_80996/g.173154 Transcript_80996/m.173154 type:complete len:288 (-) Transcript_80996:1759-2622(-)
MPRALAAASQVGTVEIEKKPASSHVPDRISRKVDSAAVVPAANVVVGGKVDNSAGSVGPGGNVVAVVAVVDADVEVAAVVDAVVVIAVVVVVDVVFVVDAVDVVVVDENVVVVSVIVDVDVVIVIVEVVVVVVVAVAAVVDAGVGVVDTGAVVDAGDVVAVVADSVVVVVDAAVVVVVLDAVVVVAVGGGVVVAVVLVGVLVTKLMQTGVSGLPSEVKTMPLPLLDGSMSKKTDVPRKVKQASGVPEISVNRTTPPMPRAWRASTQAIARASGESPADAQLPLVTSS